MLLSLALSFLVGLPLSGLLTRLRLPGLIGMLLTGILLGPHCLNLLDSGLLGISADLRQIALIIILLRAGLSLDIGDLRREGRPAALLCFVPACFEIGAYLLFAPRLLGLSLLEAAVLGAVIAAVSPAVVVPKMLRLMDEGLGTERAIPQMLLAGSSADDVFVIVLFTIFLGLAQGQSVSAMTVLSMPVSAVLGLAAGGLAGWLLSALFRRVHMRDTVKVLLLLSAAFLLVALESAVKGMVPFSGLLAVMSMGLALQKKRAVVAVRLKNKFSRLWVGAEVLLFVLVGASVDIRYAALSGVEAVSLIFLCLAVRMIGVWCCTLDTALSPRERLFCCMAYCPKATVQAAIGSVPLTMGLACGNTVLTVAVLAILITAPLGALAIDRGSRLLRPKTDKKGA